MSRLFLKTAMDDFTRDPERAKFVLRAMENLSLETSPDIFESLQFLISPDQTKKDCVAAQNKNLSKETRFLAFYRLEQNLAGHITHMNLISQHSFGIGIEIIQFWIMQKALLGPLFKMSLDFSNHLLRADLSLPNSLLRNAMPVGESVFIQFADDQEFESKDGHLLTRCYASCVPMETDSCKFVILLVFPELHKDGTIANTMNWVSLDLQHETFDESIDACLSQQSFVNVPPDIIKYAAKCLLYIKSGEPDLYKPERKPIRRRKAKRVSSTVDQNRFGLTYVGYSYASKFRDRIGDTQVRGHYRWQPYGPGRQQYKLIWIDAHMRTYGEAIAS